MRCTCSEKCPMRTGRRGITLVELIVVITIIGVVAALTLAMIPTLREKGQADKGADQVQGSLFIARCRASSERAPRGVRLIRDVTNPNFVRELQYTEQPDDFFVQPGVSAASSQRRRLGVAANTNLATLETGRQVRHELAAGRHAWLQVLRGAATLNGQPLQTSDGAAVSDEAALTIQATTQAAELMLFDLA